MFKMKNFFAFKLQKKANLTDTLTPKIAKSIRNNNKLNIRATKAHSSLINLRSKSNSNMKKSKEKPYLLLVYIRLNLKDIKIMFLV